QPGTQAPTFLIRALKDPKSANLDRIQVVKGWLDAEGQKHEQGEGHQLLHGNRVLKGGRPGRGH
ncbi:MAG TPA: DUF3604 domain-containing protein, partial [Flavobacteriales bacterium]|nr:DUF3604 domain-containing protein [Flavobacteriales bacterium]